MARHLYTLGALGVLALPAAAQQQVASATVKGLAYDSLRGRPLAGATLLFAGLERKASTDEQGRFVLDSMPTGVLIVQVQHPALDSIGIPGITRRLSISGDVGHFELSLPSYGTLWGAACGGKPKPDSGFVYGRISDAADQLPVADALVELSWIETRYDRKDGVRQRRHRIETRSNENGTYVICGVPTPQWFHLAATSASGSRGSVDLPPHELRMERRNLLIAPEATDPSLRSQLEGMLTDEAGYGYSEARVILDDTVETRTDGAGRFVFRNVPLGTRRIQVLSLGMLPLVTTVDVFPGSPATMTRTLRRVTTLDVVRVIGTNRGRVLAQQLEERRKTGFGYTMEETELAAHATLETALRQMPGARLVQDGGDFMVRTADGRGGECVASVWVDGARMAVAALNIINPKEVLAVEFFPRPSTVPMQFRGLDEQTMRCGAIALWTRWAFGKK